MGLRLASLAGKFLLSLYLATFLSLQDLGLYGLIFGVAMLAVVTFGAKVDYVFSREIVLLCKKDAWRSLRDQSVFYISNYLASIPLLLVLLATDVTRLDASILIFSWLICVFESYADLLWANTNALGRSVASNAVFFVRSGLWAFVAILLGLMVPETRTIQWVLALWVGGTGLSIFLNLIVLEVYAWPSPFKSMIDVGLYRRALKRAAPIWVGALALTGGAYVDRFVLAAHVSLVEVGIATFYLNFSSAIVLLIASSTLSVISPVLIRHVDGGNRPAYKSDVRRTKLIVVALATILAAGTALAVPLIAQVIGKPELAQQQAALWMIMVAAWLRCLAEISYFELYAHHADGKIWRSNMVFLAVSLAFTALLVPGFGLTGVGMASIVSTCALLAHREFAVRRLAMHQPAGGF